MRDDGSGGGPSPAAGRCKIELISHGVGYCHTHKEAEVNLPAMTERVVGNWSILEQMIAASAVLESLHDDYGLKPEVVTIVLRPER